VIHWTPKVWACFLHGHQWLEPFRRGCDDMKQCGRCGKIEWVGVNADSMNELARKLTDRLEGSE